MSILSRVCGILGLLAAGLLNPGAQPVINEFLASNLSRHPDNSDFDDYSDWIEIHNPLPSPVSLLNHFLTDDLNQPFKWPVPGSPEIPALGYLMFRADGFDAAPGETRVRGYWPWGSTFQTRRYHTNFRLSADGEAIGLYRTELPPSDVVSIPADAVWKYLDQGTDPGPGWVMLAFDDSTWRQGPAQLGYGDGDEATEIGYGPSSANKFRTAHFRHRFGVVDPARLGNIRCRVIVDDGAVLYLNGVEFARLRMPTGPITPTTLATGQPPAENTFETVELPRALFHAGDNLFAAEVHQLTSDSTDLSFAAELIVTEINGAPILVDAVTFGPQTTDVSYGRNATNGWSFFGSPTPEEPNLTEPLTQELTVAPAITASLAGGFYSDVQTVSLSGGDSLRFTLDGSVPDVASPAYTGALTISSNTILRARAFESGRIPGPVLTRSYFVNEPSSRTLPVVSLVADPDTLFDGVIGIYSNDTPYPYKGREVPIRVDFFESDSRPAFSVNAGVRIGGENIWRFGQKPFNLHLRGRYGDDLIHYPIFPDEPVGTFGRLNLRNGGDNWSKDMLRDAMMAPLLRGQSENDLSSYRPAVVFVNGRYWGIHDIRKHFDPVYFANEQQLAEGTYDLVQYAHNEIGVTTLMADTGSTDTYEAFREFFAAHDLSQPAHYAALLQRMNVDSFIDYVVVNDFGMNTSWEHNREFWSSRAPGAKWRWNVPDLDRCFALFNVQSSLIDDFRARYDLFRALDDNADFVNRLVQRYAAHLGSTLHSNRLAAILDRLAAEVDEEMPRHIARWAPEGGIPSLTARQTALDEIKQFAAARPAYALSRLQTELGLDRDMATLDVSRSPPGGGNLRVAGVPLTPEFNTAILLFKETPVELTAEPAPGYAFANWSDGNTNPTTTLVLSADLAVTAHFQPGAETVLPGTIETDTVLTATHPPYTAIGDVIIPANVTLTIGPGVRWLMPPGASIYVHGALRINGTSNAPVEFDARTSRPWGNLSFVNATGGSALSHFSIRNASASRLDPVHLKAAISGLNSSITLDHADIVAPFPIFTRFGATTLRHSRIHIQFTGDAINVKSGTGLVEYCVFTGEPTPDTDAIDFDDVTDGIIRGNRIHAFRGPNSDGIDVGEGCRNLLVVDNRIFHMFDKGISVGQGSVVRVERNLIVDCDMGVGVKDTGSTALIDQNTFAHNNVGVAAYEKNVGNGGGIAHVLNSIFYRSKTAPVTVDPLSILSVRYSLADTVALEGEENLHADPRFTDAGWYDFSLTAASPALDSGDPTHPLDPDLSRADMGAYYAYSPDDYPAFVPNVVVVNELMAHSPDTEPDWIELHNNSAHDLDLGGWFLSDNSNIPLKYRIADGTTLPGHGYLVFYENLHFGPRSPDPGALVPFALSENGETVNIFGPGDALRPDYSEKEDFGASATGVSYGRYYKASTRTFNFVAMANPTPGAPNSNPLVGPVVISEIMYHPPVADAEYLELANISAEPITLLDHHTGTPWEMTQGISHSFPSAPPLTLSPGERILLVRNLALFEQNYAPPAETRVFQWNSGALDNSGETLELSKPGNTNSLGARQYIRVDRVVYSDTAPWPSAPDGSGASLVRIDERAYGNDIANWTAASPTPGQICYPQWMASHTFPFGQDRPESDPDGDGLPNAIEYAFGTNPLLSSTLAANWALEFELGAVHISFALAADRPDVRYSIQKANDATLLHWGTLDTIRSGSLGSTILFQAMDANHTDAGFYRLSIALLDL
jgi:hypothetical protein